MGITVCKLIFLCFNIRHSIAKCCRIHRIENKIYLMIQMLLSGKSHVRFAMIKDLCFRLRKRLDKDPYAITTKRKRRDIERTIVLSLNLQKSQRNFLHNPLQTRLSTEWIVIKIFYIIYIIYI